MYLFTHALLSTTLIIFGSHFTHEDNYKYVVTGRVVDEFQRPVAHALVKLGSNGLKTECVECAVDDQIIHVETNYEGRFRIESGSSFSKDESIVLYAMMPPPADAFAPVTEPYPGIKGKSIVVKKNTETNAGNVPISMHYGTVAIRLRDCSGNPWISEVKRKPPLKVRLRDAGEDIFNSGRVVPPENISANDSSVAVALPYGTWHVEMAGYDGKSWIPLEAPITLDKTTSTQQATLNLPMAGEAQGPLCTRTVRVYTAETARRELRQLGFSFKKNSFVERAEKGNVKAVRLFLAAGIDPNSKDSKGRTALISASRYFDIAKALIDADADVNQKGEDGVTALMAVAASGTGNVARLLLDKGAELNARAGNGATALIVAAGNNNLEVLELLLAAGADTSVRDDNGRTALDYAIQSDDKPIISLLRLADQNKYKSSYRRPQ